MFFPSLILKLFKYNFKMFQVSMILQRSWVGWLCSFALGSSSNSASTAQATLPTTARGCRRKPRSQATRVARAGQARCVLCCDVLLSPWLQSTAATLQLKNLSEWSSALQLPCADSCHQWEQKQVVSATSTTSSLVTSQHKVANFIWIRASSWTHTFVGLGG